MKKLDLVERKLGITQPTYRILAVICVFLSLLRLWFGIHRVMSTVQLSSVRIKDKNTGVWDWILPYEDRSDFQWFGFRECIRTTLTLIIVHVVLGHIVSSAAPSVFYKALYQAIFGMLTAVFLHGPEAIITLVIVILFAQSSQLCHNKDTVKYVPLLTWVLALAILTLNSISQLIEKKHDNSSELISAISSMKVIYPVTKSLNFLILRLISFNIDRCWAVQPPQSSYDSQLGMLTQDESMERPIDEATLAQTRHVDDYNITFLLAYVFFLPLYLAGPVIPFNSFCASLHSTSSPKLQWLLWSGIRWIVFYLITDLVGTRLLLPSAIIIDRANQHYWHLFHLFDLMVLLGTSLCYTWLKFSVLWNGFRIWSILSCIHCPPNLPYFVFNHYSVQQFWKTWHASFHLWIIRYMYIPLGGKRCRVRSSLLTFLFVALWHRLNIDFAIWALITVATILFELRVEACGQHSLSRHKFHIIDDMQCLRLFCNCTFINFLLVISNLVGFVCGAAGFIRILREIQIRPAEGLAVLLIFSLFGCLHTAFLIERDSGIDTADKGHPKREHHLSSGPCFGTN